MSVANTVGAAAGTAVLGPGVGTAVGSVVGGLLGGGGGPKIDTHVQRTLAAPQGSIERAGLVAQAVWGARTGDANWTAIVQQLTQTGQSDVSRYVDTAKTLLANGKLPDPFTDLTAAGQAVIAASGSGPSLSVSSVTSAVTGGGFKTFAILAGIGSVAYIAFKELKRK